MLSEKFGTVAEITNIWLLDILRIPMREDRGRRSVQSS